MNDNLTRLETKYGSKWAKDPQGNPDNIQRGQGDYDKGYTGEPKPKQWYTVTGEGTNVYSILRDTDDKTWIKTYGGKPRLLHKPVMFGSGNSGELTLNEYKQILAKKPDYSKLTQFYVIDGFKTYGAVADIDNGRPAIPIG